MSCRRTPNHEPRTFPLPALLLDKLTTSHPVTSAQGLSLTRNFSWNLVGNVVYAGCQWGILVVLAKLTSPEMVGLFALGLAVTAPIIMLSQLQLRGVQATDANDEYAFGHYLALRLLTTALALLIIIGVIWVGSYSPNTALVIFVVGLSKAFESISDVYYGLMQRHERMDRIAKARLIKGPLSLAALWLLVYVTGDVLWGVIGLAAVWLVILLIYDVRNAAVILRESRSLQGKSFVDKEEMRPDFEPRRLAHLAWLALPLGLVMALISLNTNIPRYFIEHELGTAELGIFAALAYLMVAGNTLVSAMGQSVTPRLAKYYAAGDLDGYKHLLARMLGMGVLLSIAGVLVSVFAGHQLLSLLYRHEYALYNNILIWLMIVAGVSYITSFLGYGMTAARYFRVQLPLFMVVVAVTFGASLWLIPRFALTGAALAMGVGALAQLVGSCFVFVHILQKKNVKGVSL